MHHPHQVYQIPARTVWTSERCTTEWNRRRRNAQRFRSRMILKHSWIWRGERRDENIFWKYLTGKLGGWNILKISENIWKYSHLWIFARQALRDPLETVESRNGWLPSLSTSANCHAQVVMMLTMTMTMMLMVTMTMMMETSGSNLVQEDRWAHRQHNEGKSSSEDFSIKSSTTFKNILG